MSEVERGVHVTWSRGGTARFVSLSGVFTSLASSTPAAPGTPLVGALAGGVEVRVKVARCRKTDEGFLIEGRLVDTSRDTLTRIAALSAG